MISVVIPTRNSGRTIGMCLQSIRGSIGSPAEVIVVDNYSTDKTVELALAYGAKVYVAGPERSTQRNIGLSRATGEITVFIDSDMVLEPNVLFDLAREMGKHNKPAMCTIPEISFGTGPWAMVKKFEKALLAGNRHVEAPRAFRSKDLIQIGGWKETQVAAEDWELTKRCREAGFIDCRISAAVWHNEGNPTLQQLFKKKKYYGRDALNFLATSPDHRDGLLRRYLTRAAFVQFLQNPIMTLMLFISKSVELSGAIIGRGSSSKLVDDIYSPPIRESVVSKIGNPKLLDSWPND